MASICRFSPPFLLYNSKQIKRRNAIASYNRLYSSQTTTISTGIMATASIVRRSANYQPSIWSDEYIQSLTRKYAGVNYGARASFLKESVRTMICEAIDKVSNPLKGLVDDLHRLVIPYHFVNETGNVLEIIYRRCYKDHEKWIKMDLKLKSLGFRILRQNGFQIPEGIIDAN